MTTLQAARNLRDQFRSQGHPAPWHECLRIAAQCKQEAEERAEARRAEWFTLRRKEIKGERYLQSLRSAPLITETRHASANAREGGWTIEYCPPEKEEAA